MVLVFVVFFGLEGEEGYAEPVALGDGLLKNGAGSALLLAGEPDACVDLDPIGDVTLTGSTSDAQRGHR